MKKFNVAFIGLDHAHIHNLSHDFQRRDDVNIVGIAGVPPYTEEEKALNIRINVPTDFDFKIWDDEIHRKYTGVSNEKIKENFKKLDKLEVPFIVRTPLVSGITDSEENITNIRNFVKDFKNIKKYELLDYNPLGESKARALGKEMVVFESQVKTVKEMKQYADL